MNAMKNKALDNVNIKGFIVGSIYTSKIISFLGCQEHPKSKNLWYNLSIGQDKAECQKSSVSILAGIIIAPPRPNCAF